MSPTFTREGAAILWLTIAGPARIGIPAALVIRGILQSEHDDCLRKGERVMSRRIRALGLELDDALGEYAPHRFAA